VNWSLAPSFFPDLTGFTQAVKRPEWMFDCHMIAIYSRALTSAEIATNFDAGPEGAPVSRFGARPDDVGENNK
jgi:hypothetical protein